MSASALAAIILLGLGAMFLVYLASVAFKRGLIGIDGGAAWADLVPVSILLAGVLSGMTAIYRRTWFAAAMVLALSALVALAAQRLPV